jgi:hypothetical protein
MGKELKGNRRNKGIKCVRDFKSPFSPSFLPSFLPSILLSSHPFFLSTFLLSFNPPPFVSDAFLHTSSKSSLSRLFFPCSLSLSCPPLSLSLCFLSPLPSLTPHHPSSLATYLILYHSLPMSMSTPDESTRITRGLVMMSSCLFLGGRLITWGSTVSTPRLCMWVVGSREQSVVSCV